MSTRTFTFQVTAAPPVGLQWTPPAQGQVKAFTTNTVDNVKPTTWASPTGSVLGIFNAWCGAAFASDLGSHGSVLYHGGGHNDYDGNEVYRLDIASGAWSRLCMPTPVTVGGNTYLDQPTGEILTAYGGGTGIIAALHTYLAPFYVPPAVAGNGSGYFCIGPTNSGSGKGYVHRFDLDATGQAVSANSLWSRASNAVAGANSNGYYPSCVWDSTRNRLWFVNQGAFQTKYYDWSLGTWTTIGAWTNTVSSVTPLSYSPTLDLLVLYENAGGQNSLRIMSPTSTSAWAVADMNTANQPPTSVLCPLIWCGDLGCFLTYTGGASKRIYKLVPPANVFSGTWVWSHEDFTGDTPPYTVNGPLSKFQYIPSIKCAVYADGPSASAVAFRMTGA